MTTLTQKKLSVKAADLRGDSTLPLLYDAGQAGEPWKSNLSEDDGLFISYGAIRSAFPYRSQDLYTRELTRDHLDSVVLENDHLIATFIPGLGGKLWSLYDKDEDKELLFANHVFRPAYLALRNAWTSGGVEWNCGAMTGHHPHTCAPMFTAVIDKENSGMGCPVLRFYTYERIRAVTQQMDFYLPEDSSYLHCRMRVVNDSVYSTPMYWWSNIAVVSDRGARCVVPADYAFTTVDGAVSKVGIPVRNGIDVSYPTNNPIAIDYFFKTYENHRHYTSHINKEGYGLVQTSTSRLKGRKLFVWGQGQGGAKWQEYLSGDDGEGNYNDGKYCEIQCGLANTQYECIPMPPKTAWEWIEYYGAIHADPTKIHGEWHDAQSELESVLDKCAPLDEMEKELTDTHAMATTPADRVISEGYGWAALENKRRASAGMKQMSPHLDFGECGEEQEMWLALLENGSLKTDSNVDSAKPPISYQRRKDWIDLLKKAAAGADRDFWLTHYMLGCAALAEGDAAAAESSLSRSRELDKNAWNTYATAELYRVKGDRKLSAETMLEAASMAPSDESLAKMTAKNLLAAGMYDELTKYVSTMSDELKKVPRIRLYCAITAERTGDIDLADEMLNTDGGLEIPDIQEGEVSITDLWFSIEEKKAERDGREFDRTKVRPPKKFDFRMNVSEN